MGPAFKTATFLDRLGLRKAVAAMATLAYRNSRFSVDADGDWVNAQAEATFVSPTIHSASFARVEENVLHHWVWDYMPRPGETIIDVGAGTGEEAVIFSKLVGPQGRVISIEAHPSTFNCLRKTVALSGLTNVTTIHCAVAEADGELFMDTHDNHLASSVMAGGSTRVAARSLDSLADELGLGEIGFLKMNIEGAERLAVRGMAGMIGRLRAACISCHDFVADGGGSDAFRSKAAVLSVLEEAGFSVRTRPDDAAPWVRDYLYASRR